MEVKVKVAFVCFGHTARFSHGKVILTQRLVIQSLTSIMNIMLKKRL